MKRWKRHVSRHPVWGAVELTLGWHAVLLLVGEVLLPPLTPEWFPDLGAVAVNVACCATALIVLWRWGWLRASGVATLGNLRRWWLAAPMLLIAVTYSFSGITGSTTTLTSGLISMLWVGVNEEVYSRGLVQQTLHRLSPMRAAIIVAVLFGGGHIQNFLFFDKPLGDTLWQVLGASLFGFTCAGLRYAIGSVWPMVFVHGIDNFLQVYSPGRAPDWWQVSVMIFSGGYGWWLIRRYGATRDQAPAAAALTMRG